MQFFDGYFSALAAGTYTIQLTHTVALKTSNQQVYAISQDFTVQAPELTIDTTIVQSFYPPMGGSDLYGAVMPFIVLTDPALPWERDLVPDGTPAGPSNPTPWMALMIFAEGEISLQPGTNSPVQTVPVSQLLAADPNTLKPALPQGWVSQELLDSTCQTITISGAAFNAVMPQTDELPFLGHCRGLDLPAEGQGLLSVLLSNRLPVAAGSPMRYYAHLVSLEGFASYLGPNATPIPAKPSSTQLQDVQLVSLFNWTFVSLPEPDFNFTTLIRGLIGSEAATAGVLALPVPSTANVPAPVAARLNDGYVPLTLTTVSGDESFAWYRGPFSAVVPQPLPQAGNPPVDVSSATNADELTIYLEEQGLFDLSYAAAWNIGRQLALADSQFTNAITTTRLAANAALNAIAQRLAMPHFAGETDPRVLLARDASRRRFAERVGAGLGRMWTRSLEAARNGEVREAPRTAVRMARRRRTPAVLDLLARQDVVDAIGENVDDSIATIGRWLANLALLYPIPFSHLVPNPDMLPPESIRFFYIDQGWIDAMLAGATSIAIHSTADQLLVQALQPRIRTAMRRHRRASFTRRSAAPSAQASGTAMTGMLIRSQLVAAWPTLVIDATLGDVPMTIVRDDTPSPTVRLTLFDGIPDTVTLAEPYQGLLFGVQDNGGTDAVSVRVATDPRFTGAPLNVTPVTPAFRTPAAQAMGGVLDVATLAPALATAAGVMPFASDAVVNWNGTPLTTTFVTPTQLTAPITADLIAGAGAASVTVTSGGATSQPVPFLIDPTPAIDSIEPQLAIAGGPDLTIDVFGIGFDSTAVVQWNGTGLTTAFVSVAQVSAVVPAASIATSTIATITVQTSSGTTAGTAFNVVTANPVIETLDPAVLSAGSPGFTLYLTGFELGADSVVQWNGTALATTFLNGSEVTAAVPSSLLAAAGSASVTVATGGATSNALAFTIAGSEPVIAAISPGAAMAGANAVTLTVAGANFGSDSVVQWNGTALTTTYSDAEEVTATIPAGNLASAGSASITVETGGVASAAAAFTIIGALPVIALLDPAATVAGGAPFTLTVYGGFGAGDFALQVILTPEFQSFTPQ